MNKKILFILLIPISLFSQNKCTITYISNEGFLLEVNDKKVVIDGIFNSIDGDWCDSPTDSIIELVKHAKPPFNDVDVIAITHQHRDHFDQKLVVEYMLANPNASIICPNQVNKLLSLNTHYEKISSRIISVTPNEFSDTNVVVSDVPCRVIRLEHSHYEILDTISGKYVNKHRNIENLGFLFELDGVKIFHCGDTNPSNVEEYNTYKLFNENIDIAFMERQFFSHYRGQAIKTIKQYTNPKHIVLMHIRPENKRAFYDYSQKVENLYVLRDKLEKIQIDTE